MKKKLNYKEKTLFLYSLKNFTPSERVRFHYLLKGRGDEKGILKEIKAEKVGKGVILIATKEEDTLKDIFQLWKIRYKTKRGLFES